VWENILDYPYAPGVNAADGPNPAWYVPYGGTTVTDAAKWRGPHQYGLRVNGYSMPQDVSAIPNCTIFFPNGFVHTLHSWAQ